MQTPLTMHDRSDIASAIISHAKLFDTELQAVIGTTLEGAIVYWNAAAERLYGWSEAEVLGRDVLDVTPSQMTRDAAEELMDRLRSGRSWSGRFVVRARDGVEFTASVRDVPVHDSQGTLVGIVGISTRVD